MLLLTYALSPSGRSYLRSSKVLELYLDRRRLTGGSGARCAGDSDTTT